MRRPGRTGTVVAALLTLVAGCTATDGATGPPESGSPVEAVSSYQPATRATAGVDATNDDPTTAQTSPPSALAPRTITVVMNGDMLLHEGLWATARMDAERTGRGSMDYRPLLADMRPVVHSADLAICHLETPLAPRSGPFSGYPLFSVPPQIVPALSWEGYDACTTASNHSLDQGLEGLRRTLDDLDAGGIAHAGTATTLKAAHTPLIMDVVGVQVALISETYGTNGIPVPEEAPWSVPVINIDAIERKAAKAKRQGADIVLVALHWGLEYDHEPIQDQLDVARALTKDPDIDFVYGHHAHVVQPYDRVNGTWVVYGLGNAVAQQDTAVEGVYDGNTCRVTFAERRGGSFGVQKLEYIPTMITPFDDVHPMRWLDVPAGLADPNETGLHRALAATEDRVTDVVGMLGAFRHGVVEGR